MVLWVHRLLIELFSTNIRSQNCTFERTSMWCYRGMPVIGINGITPFYKIVSSSSTHDVASVPNSELCVRKDTAKWIQECFVFRHHHRRVVEISLDLVVSRNSKVRRSNDLFFYGWNKLSRMDSIAKCFTITQDHQCHLNLVYLWVKMYVIRSVP